MKAFSTGMSIRDPRCRCARLNCHLAGNVPPSPSCGLDEIRKSSFPFSIAYLESRQFLQPDTAISVFLSKHGVCYSNTLSKPEQSIRQISSRREHPAKVMEHRGKCGVVVRKYLLLHGQRFLKCSQGSVCIAG